MGLDGRYSLLYGIVGVIMLDTSTSKLVNGARFYPCERILSTRKNTSPCNEDLKFIDLH